ncbi:MAG: menaquinone-dependent protoporphyrinogen IX dehydrogenase [Planctomycetota bacterium]|nr:menaquinone-dependent protoporphyrinogen IX dehydrogenase [Planctomycetota bacterium]
MLQILIVYDTTEGQTRKIVQHVADAATGLGHQVELHEIRRLPRDFTVGRFDAVIVGASIHMGKHSKRLAQFVGKHRADLGTTLSAFFSVSLSAAGTESERMQAEKYVGEFLAQTGWNPQMTATFGGGLHYREYGFLKRWMMTKIARDAGKDTDTSRNHEYTDWTAVDRFVNDLLVSLGTEGQKS